MHRMRRALFEGWKSLLSTPVEYLRPQFCLTHILRAEMLLRLPNPRVNKIDHLLSVFDLYLQPALRLSYEIYTI